MLSQSVLFVDDNELLLVCMKRIFEKLFCHVAVVSNGCEACMQLRRQRFDIIVLDLNLPDIHGLQLLEYVTLQTPASRVVIFSADNDEKTRQDALRKGALEFIEKPVEFDRLRSTLLGYCSAGRTTITESNALMISWPGGLMPPDEDNVIPG